MFSSWRFLPSFRYLFIYSWLDVICAVLCCGRAHTLTRLYHFTCLCMWCRCRFHHHIRGPKTVNRHYCRWTLLFTFAHTNSHISSFSVRFFFSVVLFFECFSTHIFPKADFILCLVISFFVRPPAMPSSITSLLVFVLSLPLYVCICARSHTFTNFCNIVKFLYCLSFVFSDHIFAIFILTLHQFNHYNGISLYLDLLNWLWCTHTLKYHIFVYKMYISTRYTHT